MSPGSGWATSAKYTFPGLALASEARRKVNLTALDRDFGFGLPYISAGKQGVGFGMYIGTKFAVCSLGQYSYSGSAEINE